MKIMDKVKLLIPFTPLIAVFLILILRPYYLFPVGGDTDFHLLRAREILENPLIGLFWSNLTYYPMGRPIWHQPLFNAVCAFFWYIGGVRFAQTVMCFMQILITVGVAICFAKKEYGDMAGFFAGFFALFVPAVLPLSVPIPASFVPILAVLTIYYILRDKKKALITSLIALWTHMMSITSFIPLFLADNYRNKTNLKIIAILLPSWLFWMGYWIYFRDRLVTGGFFYSLLHPTFMCADPTLPSFYIQTSIFLVGSVGLYLLYKINYRQFKLFITYILIVIIFSFFGFNGDFLRGLQFSALPMAILASFTVQTGYEYLENNHGSVVSIVFLIMVVFYSLLGMAIFVGSLPNKESGHWENLQIPFEGHYNPLKSYIIDNTHNNQVIW
ncbi:MAG: hypothetical protein HVN35_05505, partial [Methanobacteriaceae archaeon]|nr:hypothetical protein [Methanobacteriaceae archaeon]